MKQNLINSLPLPPKDKKGWPWTKETPVHIRFIEFM